MNAVIRFLRHPSAERGLLVKSACLLLLYGAALRVLSFRWIRAHLMMPLPAPVATPDPRLSPEQIARATEAMAARLGVSCVPKALAARRLMHSAGYPSQLRIGVISQPTFEAHAWLEHEGSIIVGGDTGLEFGRLYDVE